MRGDTIPENGSDAGHDLQTLSNLGINLDAITEKLQADAVASFASAYDRVLAALGKKRDKMLATHTTAW